MRVKIPDPSLLSHHYPLPAAPNLFHYHSIPTPLPLWCWVPKSQCYPNPSFLFHHHTIPPDDGRVPPPITSSSQSHSPGEKGPSHLPTRSMSSPLSHPELRNSKWIPPSVDHHDLEPLPLRTSTDLGKGDWFWLTATWGSHHASQQPLRPPNSPQGQPTVFRGSQQPIGAANSSQGQPTALRVNQQPSEPINSH